MSYLHYDNFGRLDFCFNVPGKDKLQDKNFALVDKSLDAQLMETTTILEELKETNFTITFVEKKHERF